VKAGSIDEQSPPTTSELQTPESAVQPVHLLIDAPEHFLTGVKPQKYSSCLVVVITASSSSSSSTTTSSNKGS